MLYKYDERNSGYENKVLRDIESVMQKEYQVTYTGCGDNIILSIFNYYTSNIYLTIVLNNNNLVLSMNGEKIKLTSAIIQKCQELLLQYSRAKSQKRDSKQYEYEQKIIATEQTRDIYTMVSGLFSYNRMFTKSPKPDIVFVPQKTKIKKAKYDPLYVYGIGFPKIRKKKSQILFSNKKALPSIDLDPKKGTDGMYHLTINGKDFVFKTYDFAQYFGELFDWCNFVVMSKPINSTIFIRYKDKVRRQR